MQKLKGDDFTDDEEPEDDDTPAEPETDMSKSYDTNASEGLDVMKPVNDLKASLKQKRESLSKTVVKIQGAHDQAKANNKLAKTLEGEENESMKQLEAARQVLKKVSDDTLVERIDEHMNFPPLPKEVDEAQNEMEKDLKNGDNQSEEDDGEDNEGEDNEEEPEIPEEPKDEDKNEGAAVPNFGRDDVFPKSPLKDDN